ncbi:MAG: hypothetical protein J6P21_00595 [Clostridia bacterium]|nr:hypothetical protein [Clostridia bacterium]
MSKFRKSKSKLAVALLGTLFCHVNGASAMNSRVNINKTGVKSSQTLGAVGRATSGNISINNSNNNKNVGWVKNHKWQLGIGGLSVATVVTLAIVGGKYLSKKDNDPGKGPDPAKDKKKSNDKKINKDKNKEKEKEKVSDEFPYKQENLNLISSAGKLEGLDFDYYGVFNSIITCIQNGGLDSNNACQDIVDVLLGRKKLEKFEFEAPANVKSSCFANLTVGEKVYSINFNGKSQFIVADYSSGDVKKLSGLINAIQN